LDLEEQLVAFLEHQEKSVMLVSGYSGSGKSTLAKRIRLRLWKQHQDHLHALEARRAAEEESEEEEEGDAEGGRRGGKRQEAVVVPVWVHLPTLAVPLSDLMHESLAKQHGFGDAQLREFQTKVHEGHI
jgi:energy-coupling factor transporter ATP-binding protein EcfA2